MIHTPPYRPAEHTPEPGNPVAAHAAAPVSADPASPAPTATARLARGSISGTAAPPRPNPESRTRPAIGDRDIVIQTVYFSRESAVVALGSQKAAAEQEPLSRIARNFWAQMQALNDADPGLYRYVFGKLYPEGTTAPPELPEPGPEPDPRTLAESDAAQPVEEYRRPARGRPFSAPSRPRLIPTACAPAPAAANQSGLRSDTGPGGRPAAEKPMLDAAHHMSINGAGSTLTNPPARGTGLPGMPPPVAATRAAVAPSRPAADPVVSRVRPLRFPCAGRSGQWALLGTTALGLVAKGIPAWSLAAGTMSHAHPAALGQAATVGICRPGVTTWMASLTRPAG